MDLEFNKFGFVKLEKPKPDKMKKLIFPFLWVALSMTSHGQTDPKLGHVNMNDILTSLPIIDSIQTVLEDETKEIESVYEEMQVVHNRLLEEYNNDVATYSELVKKTKENEILDQQKRLQEFEQNANQNLQQRNMELIQPVYNDIYKAIDRVAAELGLEYVFDISKGSVVYTSKDARNINSLVIELLTQN